MYLARYKDTTERSYRLMSMCRIPISSHSHIELFPILLFGGICTLWPLLLSFFKKFLLPLNGGGRLGADVVADPIDAPHLIDNSTRHVAHHLVGKVEEVGRHVICRLHAADAANILIGPAISHNADALHTGKENNKGLADGTVLPGLVQLLDHDGIRLLERFDALGRDTSKDADGKAGAGKGMAPNTHFVNTEGHSKLADLILEQFSEGLNELKLHGSGKTANIVVRLDGGTGSLVRYRFDDVGIKRALEEEVAGSSLLDDAGSLLLEDLNEGGTDDLALLLGVLHVLEKIEESVIWPELYSMCNNYAPFVVVNKQKYVDILKKQVELHYE